MARNPLQKLSKEINAQARRHYSGVVAALPEDVPPRRSYSFRESDEFYPTDGDGFGRVIRASRQEALNAIHTPVRAGRPNEHAWLWVPGESLWIDATIESRAAEVDYDKCLHAFLSHAFGDVEMLHTHPTPAVEKAYEDGEMSENYLMEGALPSRRDLKILSNMQAACPPDASLSGSIVSHYGATTYTLGKAPGRYHDFAIQGAYEQRVSGSSLEPTLAIREALADISIRSHFVLGDEQYLALGRVPRYAFVTSFEPLGGPA